jgi:hypothetical protein
LTDQKAMQAVRASGSPGRRLALLAGRVVHHVASLLDEPPVRARWTPPAHRRGQLSVESNRSIRSLQRS